MKFIKYSTTIIQSRLTSRLSNYLNRSVGVSFYFQISFVLAILIVFGFAHSLVPRLLKAPYSIPLSLTVHISLFTAWLILLLIQCGLIRADCLKTHRSLGLASLVIGIMLPVAGVWVTLQMGVIHQQRHDSSSSGIIFPLSDMLHFVPLYGLAMLWRRHPAYHKRLIILATITLSRAAYFRYPPFLHPNLWVLFAEDVLILVCVVRDLVVERRIHTVYRVAFPVLAAAQMLEIGIVGTEIWQQMADEILRFSAAVPFLAP
jgi:hypothetical protein